MIDAVTPDYYARFPKACMGGWGQALAERDAVGPRAPVPRGGDAFPVSNSGPCAIMRSPISGSTRPRSWRFAARHWMKEPCASCIHREKDFGGCRCQAFAMTGDARIADPVCHLSPHHQIVAELAEADGDQAFVYRGR